LEQASNIHRPQHCMDVQATAIGWQVGKAKTREVVGKKLVEKVCYFLREVTQLAVFAKTHSVCADHLLPPQSSPTTVVLPTTMQTMGDFTSPLRTGPDIASDAQTAALVLFTSLLAQVRPPPIRSKWGVLHYSGLTGLVLPVVVFKSRISIVDPRCKDKENKILLLHVIVC
jgi:hypothetical protein